MCLKKGYIIYNECEMKKNRWFIEKFIKEGETFGLSFFFVSKENYQKMPLCDLVINRTRDPDVSRWYEKQQVPVFHGSELVETGNHKWKTYTYLKKAWLEGGQNLPETMFIQEFTREKFCQILREWNPGKEDLILKTVDGHGGDEVYCLQQKELIQGFKSKTEQFFQRIAFRDCIIQERIDSYATDLRVYIVGNRIYHGILRRGKDDFRSNYSLGGITENYDFHEKEQKIIEKYVQIFSKLCLGMAGIDFIVKKDGTLVFNELEEMVGCRMLYANSEKDIVKDYIRWIFQYVSP